MQFLYPDQDNYELRVRCLEALGATTSDAQACADAMDSKPPEMIDTELRTLMVAVHAADADAHCGRCDASAVLAGMVERGEPTGLMGEHPFVEVTRGMVVGQLAELFGIHKAPDERPELSATNPLGIYPPRHSLHGTDKPVHQLAPIDPIHYPECWDTNCFPTREDAMRELAYLPSVADFKCSNDDCPHGPVDVKGAGAMLTYMKAYQLSNSSNTTDDELAQLQAKADVTPFVLAARAAKLAAELRKRILDDAGDAALNAGSKVIQDALGVKSGDYAADWFDIDCTGAVRDMFENYFDAEVARLLR